MQAHTSDIDRRKHADLDLTLTLTLALRLTSMLTVALTLTITSMLILMMQLGLGSLGHDGRDWFHSRAHWLLAVHADWHICSYQVQHSQVHTPLHQLQINVLILQSLMLLQPSTASSIACIFHTHCTAVKLASSCCAVCFFAATYVFASNMVRIILLVKLFI